MNDSAGPVVVVLNEHSGIEIDMGRWQRLAAQSLESSGVMNGELNLIFVDESAMTKLNAQHMGKNYATDVLSFPLDGSDVAELGESLIGDVLSVRLGLRPKQVTTRAKQATTGLLRTN